MQQKAKQTADLLKSTFSKEAINKTIQAVKNSEIIKKARNTLNPTNMNAASKKIYEDVVKSSIAKTQAWLQAAKSMTNAVASNGGKILNVVQMGLDVVGLVPFWGEIADGVNGAIYAARGDKLNAALSFSAMIPVVGSAATAGKYVNKGIELTENIADSSKTTKGVSDNVISEGIDNAKDLTKLTVDDIPTAKSGNFNEFFNSLTSSELDELWKDKKIRKKIERQLREPGGLHEWHLVSRAPQFKYWNIGAEEIRDLRTAISDVKFINPSGVHGGLGSTKAHNELLAIIDTSNDYNTFVRRLNNLDRLHFTKQLI